MIKHLILGVILLINCNLYAQKYNISWGEELKMRKRAIDLTITGADKTGYYFTELRYKVGINAANQRAKLIKFNNSFEEEWEEDFGKELKGLDFISIQTLNEDLYLFASDYVRKEKSYKVYATTINRSNGKLNSEFLELASFDRESKKDDFEVKLSKMKDGKNFLLVSNLSSKDQSTIGISSLDNQLKKKTSTIINLTYEPGLYELQDAKLISDRIVLLGKVFSEELYRKKRTRKVFKSYVLEIFDLKGKKIKTLPLDVKDNFALEGKLLDLDNNEIAISGFYSKDAKKKNLNGFFIQKIDVLKGELTINSSKDISPSMIGQNYTEEEDDKTKKAAPAKKSNDDDDDDDESFENNYIIKSVDVNPVDGSIMIAAEITHNTLLIRSNRTPGVGNSPGTTSTFYTYMFSNQDILLICANKNGEIKWLNTVPKKQSESVTSGNKNGATGIYAHNSKGYFINDGGMPFHSSFKSLFVDGKYVIIYNDHNQNSAVLGYNDKVKEIYNFEKYGTMYGLNIDVATGKMTKTPISSCADDGVVTMPRHSYLINNTLIVPAWRMKTIGKTTFKIAKVTIQ